MLEEFNKVGIWFDDPVKAAYHVNEIWDDPLGWWFRKDVQEVRRKFCYFYARADRLWWLRWLSVLTKI